MGLGATFRAFVSSPSRVMRVRERERELNIWDFKTAFLNKILTKPGNRKLMAFRDPYQFSALSSPLSKGDTFFMLGKFLFVLFRTRFTLPFRLESSKVPLEFL